ncbi:MAG: DNA modification methylase [Chloroflexi bacterium]|nr:DNA modification methylase [Chloroflexota bacterium]
MSAKAAAAAPSAWRNRIVGTGEEAPDQLVANPANWRTHPAAQRNALRGSLDTVGWVQQCIVNQRTGFVVDGHARIEEALSRGEPTVPVLYVDLSPEEEALVLASLDPIGAMADRDGARLAALLAGVTVTDAGLAALLDSMRPPRAGLVDPDDVPDVPEESYVKPGDLWALGDHRLLCGDATSADDVARLFAGETAVLMATDPPYLMDYRADNHPQSWTNKGPAANKHWDDYRDPAASVAFFASFIRAALPHLAADAPIYQWHADLRRQLVVAAWEECGLLFHQPLVWVKARSILTRSHFMWQHEVCAYGWLTGHQPKRRPPANATTVWQIDQVGESDGIHPTQKPVEVFRRPMEWHTVPGDLCYDPFLGSGTSLIAAEMLGRRCAAMEIEPRYVQVALERWEAFTGETAERIDG